MTATVAIQEDPMIQTSAIKGQPHSSTLNGIVAPTRSVRRRPVKQRLTITLPEDMLNRLRNTVYWTPYLTLAGLIETAVAAKLGEIEKQNGEPFPTRSQELKGGRPRRIRPSSNGA